MDTQKILKLKEDKGVALVEFYATWCPHCQRMMPVVDDVRALLEGSATVYQFDIDENEALANEFNVSGIPTFIVFKDGKEVSRQSGEMDGSKLVAMVQAAM